ncbi:MAG TPA: hypothetical protein VLF94_06260 [Chlamydiales bacterium]|nr:hypothetical protein [Chlamydiales bacterium]
MRKWLIPLIALFALLTAFLPKIASTPPFNPLFVRILESRSPLHMHVDHLDLSWLGPQKFHQIQWTHDNATGSIEEFSIDAPFWSFRGPFQLKNGSLSYQNANVEKIEGQLIDNDFELTGVAQQGTLSLKGKIYSQFHFHIGVDIQNFPLLAIDPRLDQIFGPTLTLNGALQMESGKGRIDLNIASPNITTQLHGYLTEQAITLREPLAASIRLTPEICALFLKDANPLFLASLEASKPLSLRIAQDGLHFPLPFSLEHFLLNGTLDLGQTRGQTGKALTTIIKFVKEEPTPHTNLWFAPFAFRLHDGILEAGRMDALVADSIHICTWGHIDLMRDQIHMFLGIPAKTLRKFFGIRNLPEHYVLKIPIQGSTGHPEVVKGQAVARVAALVAGSQVSKRGYLGSLNDLFHPAEEEDIPHAQHPFPWEE